MNRMKSKPQRWYIVGLKLADGDVVYLTANGEHQESKSVFCTQDMAEAIASKWVSTPDLTQPEKPPLFDEVTVVKGSCKTPFFAEKHEIACTVQPRPFSIGGKASKTSDFALLQERILKTKGAIAQ
jgi:hypothetical protein